MSCVRFSNYGAANTQALRSLSLLAQRQSTLSPGMKGKKIELTTLISRLRLWILQVCNTNRRNFSRSRLQYKFHDEDKEIESNMIRTYFVLRKLSAANLPLLKYHTLIH